MPGGGETDWRRGEAGGGGVGDHRGDLDHLIDGTMPGGGETDWRRGEAGWRRGETDRCRGEAG